jgi:hypothetical protein
MIEEVDNKEQKFYLWGSQIKSLHFLMESKVKP